MVRFRPRSRAAGLAYDAATVVFGSVLIALAAGISIPLPFTPVMITLQTLVILVLAASVGSVRAAATVGVYILEGIAGLPVFQGGGAGLAHFAGPTGGYIVGFLVAAYVVGLICERGWGSNVLKTATAMLLGNAVIYLLGVPWLSRFTGWETALSAGLYPFIVGDLIKVGIGALVVSGAWRLGRHHEDSTR